MRCCWDEVDDLMGDHCNVLPLHPTIALAAAHARQRRERELAAVKINADDVTVIATEFELDKKAAEAALREAGGVLENALKALL